MPYQADISRVNPGLFLFLIDQSGSMADALPDLMGGKRKSQFLADALNRILYNLTIRCAKSEGVRDYFEVGILGFGNRINYLLQGTSDSDPLLAISRMAEAPLRVENRLRKIDDGTGGIVEQAVKFPVWVDPHAENETRLVSCLNEAERIARAWADRHPQSFPPVIMVFTDGEATDGNPRDAYQKLGQVATADGNAVVFNVHISSNPAQPVSFPSAELQAPDEYSHLLFETSSQMPPFMRLHAQELGFARSAEPRCYVFNADSSMIVSALEIGTRPAPLR